MSYPVVYEIKGIFCEIVPKYYKKSKILASISEDALTTSEAIRKYYKNGKVAAMNFANAFRPGGGTAFHRGDLEIRTQEENILTLTPDAYTTLLDHKHLYPLCNNGNRSLYIQNVNLTFNDDFTKSDVIYTYDMLVAPAIDVHNIFIAEQRKLFTDEKLIDKYMRPMLNNLLIECIKNQVKIVILGPWGCGVFAPHDYAEKTSYVTKVMTMMYEVVSEFRPYFDHIVFTKAFTKSQAQLDYEFSKKFKQTFDFLSRKERLDYRKTLESDDENSSDNDFSVISDNYRDIDLE
jgi:uncharacterized protein (TIGR02452 family)